MTFQIQLNFKSWLGPISLTDDLEHKLGATATAIELYATRAPVLQHGPVQQQQHTIKLSYFQGWGVGG